MIQENSSVITQTLVVAVVVACGPTGSQATVSGVVDVAGTCPKPGATSSVSPSDPCTGEPLHV